MKGCQQQYRQQPSLDTNKEEKQAGTQSRDNSNRRHASNKKNAGNIDGQFESGLDPLRNGWTLPLHINYPPGRYLTKRGNPLLIELAISETY